MITNAKALFTILDAQDIAYICHHHPPTHHYDDHREIRDNIPGMHCKSLFLTDKEYYYMVCMRGELRLDLKKLQQNLQSKRLSFGKGEMMQEILAVAPGSCTPYALVNDHGYRIHKVILDNTFETADSINFHPIENNATIRVSYNDFIKWLDFTGHQYISLEL
ncbi:MAG: prolyl-tRNA synthetase associated domain-containing protein [Alphaproteobacteria bacterium]